MNRSRNKRYGDESSTYQVHESDNVRAHGRLQGKNGQCVCDSLTQTPRPFARILGGRVGCRPSMTIEKLRLLLGHDSADDEGERMMHDDRKALEGGIDPPHRVPGSNPSREDHPASSSALPFSSRRPAFQVPSSWLLAPQCAIVTATQPAIT